MSTPPMAIGNYHQCGHRECASSDANIGWDRKGFSDNCFSVLLILKDWQRTCYLVSQPRFVVPAGSLQLFLDKLLKLTAIQRNGEVTSPDQTWEKGWGRREGSCSVSYFCWSLTKSWSGSPLPPSKKRDCECIHNVWCPWANLIGSLLRLMFFHHQRQPCLNK